ncbi:MAG: rRNA pseudouridine synthase [Nanoarchaeota archaeon]|nr:rRNA pseudouridine synthase [Nanoarchaeota archaeon]
MDRVQKIIAESGLCSRRKAEELIEAGKVKVNGVVIGLGDKADRDVDDIKVDGKKIAVEDKVYYLLHKPKNYLCTSRDMYDRKTVLELVPKGKRVFSVGRLDRDATGLLLLTNDGDFGNKVMHPSHEVKKTYIAVLDLPFKPSDAKKLEEGIKIDRQVVKGKIIILDKKTIAITVHSGMNKVIKRICKALGYYVRQLHRTHIGSLAVDVPVGEFRELSPEELKLVFKQPKISKATFTDS